MDKGESVSQYVALAVEVIDQSGLSYKLGPMGTSIEGEWRQVMEVVNQCYERLAQDCNRITCTVHMDYRRGHSGRLEAKVRAVESRLGRKLPG